MIQQVWRADCSSGRVESDIIAEVERKGNCGCVHISKSVTSRVTNHFHLLRIEGVLGCRAFYFKMKTVLAKYSRLPGTEGTLEMWDFCCSSWESSGQTSMSWSP